MNRILQKIIQRGLLISLLVCCASMVVTPVIYGAPTVEIKRVVANCESEPYGRAIKSFTFHVNSVDDVLDLTADDFQCTHFIFDAMETHEPFDSKALNVYFTASTVVVEVPPFYPDLSYSREGYWAMTCTNPAFNVDAGTKLEYNDPVAEAFEFNIHTYGDAVLEYYLYTPQGADKNMPILIFNSGGTGISTTGDVYGAPFAVSFAKPEAQAILPCYILYPQRTAGSTENQISGIKEIVDNLVAAGKVDSNRIYMSGESAGAGFTFDFIDRHPGWCAAIVVFAGREMSDDEVLKLANSGTKVLFCSCLGDTTAPPSGFASNYERLIKHGMVPGKDVIWHYYTAETFNALLSDRTIWKPMADGDYVTDPITGTVSYYYPDGKLHNTSYPAANDTYIKIWLLHQSKAPYSVEWSEQYSASGKTEDYSIIPERYVKYAVIEDVPGVPAGTTGTFTVYSDEDESFFYLEFHVNPPLDARHPDAQFAEAVIVNGVGRIVMDCSGGWWTNDLNNATLPHLLKLKNIEWKPYTEDRD